MTQLPNNLISRFLVVGLITLVVAIADEIYQSFIPFRNASVTDVFLDLLGISLVLIVFSKYYKKSQKAWGL
jgi:VanZ family protein